MTHIALQKRFVKQSKIRVITSQYFTGSESSDEESSATDGETDRYAGYQCLPTSEAPHESEIGEERNLSASIMKDFQEVDLQ